MEGKRGENVVSFWCARGARLNFWGLKRLVKQHLSACHSSPVRITTGRVDKRHSLLMQPPFCWAVAGGR